MPHANNGSWLQDGGQNDQWTTCPELFLSCGSSVPSKQRVQIQMPAMACARCHIIQSKLCPNGTSAQHLTTNLEYKSSNIQKCQYQRTVSGRPPAASSAPDAKHPSRMLMPALRPTPPRRGSCRKWQALRGGSSRCRSCLPCLGEWATNSQGWDVWGQPITISYTPWKSNGITVRNLPAASNPQAQSVSRHLQIHRKGQ